MANRGPQRGVTACIVLSVLTLGLFMPAWLFWITRELRERLGLRDLHPLLDAVLCVLFLPYGVFWAFKASRLVALAREAAGLPREDRTALNVALALFGLGVITLANLQDDLNGLWAAG